MRIRVSKKDVSELEADLVVCFAREADAKPRAIADPGLRRELAREMRAEGFRGRVGDQLVWNANGRYASRRFLVVGLGSGDDDGAIRTASARAARAAQDLAARRLALRLPDVSKERAAEIFMEEFGEDAIQTGRARLNRGWGTLPGRRRKAR